MGKNTKETTAKDLIRWNSLSRYETEHSTEGSIRSNKIPEKYQDRVKQLLKYIEHWMDGEELMTEKTAKVRVRDEMELKLKEVEAKYKEIGTEIHEMVKNSF
jgi:molecular chaperone DnaK (HSP70)